MAVNPIVYNSGGMFRFADYVSQLPEFIREEQDVVLLLQLFSDYINNAYRNLTVVSKFSFKLVASDATVTQTRNKLQKLADLFSASEARGTTVLFVSKPQGNPNTGLTNGVGVPFDAPIFKQYINYAGTADSVGPSVATIPLLVGDKIYVNFTDPEQAIYSAVYVYTADNTLIIDPNNSSQDPFNQTSNEPFQTVAGLTPRMLEFNVADISTISAKRFAYDNGINYYEVYFSASITNITNIPSSVAVEYDVYKYLVDYYNSVNIVPSIYSGYYSINFANSCPNMDWHYNEELGLINIPGYSLFYARPLTQIAQSTATGNNKQTPTKYVDPLYNPNTFQIGIIDITSNGSSYLTINTSQPHKLSVGDKVTITNNIQFNGDYIVTSILSRTEFQVNSGVNVSISSKGGMLVIRNLYYTKYLNDVNSTHLIIPYTNLIADMEIQANHDVVRIVDENSDDTNTFNANADSVNLINYSIALNSSIEWVNGINVTVKPADAVSVLPSGLVEGVQYPFYIIDATKNLIQFGDVVLGNTGSGTIQVAKVNRYFNADTDVNIAGNCITFNSVSGIQVGDYVMFTNKLDNAVLPSPLNYNYPYRILVVDPYSNKIHLDGIDITSVGSGLVDVELQIIDIKSQGTTLFSMPKNPLSTGNLIMNRVEGDLISIGKFAVVSNSKFIAVATINTNAVLWNGSDSNVYNKGTYVVYPDSNGIYQRYIVTKTDVIIPSATATNAIVNCRPNSSSITPASQPNNSTLSKYVLDMNDITYADSYLDTNPYMFGMYRVVPLNLNDTIDVSSGFGNLTEQMYIQKEEELSLRYGFEQRNFLFNPRTAPPEILVRNGWLDMTSTNDVFDPITQGVTDFVVANTAENIQLFNNVKINTMIAEFVVTGTTGYITTLTAHGYKTGNQITISGANQSIANDNYIVNVTGASTYTIQLPIGFPSIVTGSLISTYQTKVNDYINVTSQTNPSQNGIYIVTVDYWKLYNSNEIGQGTVIFSPTNLFDISALNPMNATMNPIVAIQATTIGSNTVQLKFNQFHNLLVNNTITVTGAVPDYYNGTFNVASTPSTITLTYEIPEQPSALIPPTGTIVVAGMGWYRYTLNDIQWQQKTLPLNTYELGTTGSIYVFSQISGYKYANNVTQLNGLYEISVLSVTKYVGMNAPVATSKCIPNEGDVVELSDQLNANENGVWRVSKGLWKKLKDEVDTNPPSLSSPVNVRLVAKVGQMGIDAYPNESPSPLQLADGTYVPYVYSVYSEADVLQYINQNATSQQQIYMVGYTYMRDWSFNYEYVPNIDAGGPFQKQYDATYDYNTVVNPFTMKPGWVGIPTMKYPLVEKIGRLIYQKDPNIIDLDVIGYLGRYLGYDITTVLEDLQNNPYYTTDAEVELALRKTIENLPSFYALKSTESGLQSLLTTFGIVGELVTMWTDANDPYGDFIPDYQIASAQIQNTASGRNVNYIPTPHFKILANVEGPGFNQFLPDDVQRIFKSITSYKPINTVFDGMIKFIEAKLNASIRAGTIRTVGKFQCNVGYGDDLDFEPLPSNNFNNDCI